MPRRKLSASRLAAIHVERVALQAHMVDSPSEKFDLSGAEDVSEFKKRRGKLFHLFLLCHEADCTTVPAPLKPYYDDTVSTEKKGMRRSPSTPRVGVKSFASPCLPAPALSPKFRLASPATPVSAH